MARDMFLKAFLFPERLSIGVSLTAGETRYSLVYKNRSGNFHFVSGGNGIPLWLSCFLPLVVHTDLSYIPVMIHAYHIGREDPDAWIESHESAIERDQVDNQEKIREYVIRGSMVYRIDLSAEARDQFLKKLRESFEADTLSPPLWKLAGLYMEKLKKPFLLWKVSGSGSVLAKVGTDTIEKICNFWPDTEDLQEKPDLMIDEAAPVIESLMAPEKLPVILFSPEKDFQIPQKFFNGKFPFENPPEIKGVGQHDHETYSLACSRGDEPNLVPFEKVQKVKHVKSMWRTLVITARWLAALLIASFLFIGGAEKLSDLYVHLNGQKLAGVKEKIDALEKANAMRDSVMARFREKAGFIADESKITNLLSDFQNIFPEGVWAEEITVLDSEDRSYRIDIRAVASSSGLIGSFMEKLSGTRGISGCRMIYSEQIPAKQEIKGIRVKIQAVWR